LAILSTSPFHICSARCVLSHDLVTPVLPRERQWRGRPDRLQPNDWRGSTLVQIGGPQPSIPTELYVVAAWSQTGSRFVTTVDPSNATDRHLPAPRPNRWLLKELATVDDDW